MLAIFGMLIFEYYWLQYIIATGSYKN
jgi:hypothetical protein